METAAAKPVEKRKRKVTPAQRAALERAWASLRAKGARNRALRAAGKPIPTNGAAKAPRMRRARAGDDVMETGMVRRWLENEIARLEDRAKRLRELLETF